MLIRWNDMLEPQSAVDVNVKKRQKETRHYMCKNKTVIHPHKDL